MSISSIERTDKVITEVLLVLEELGRVDLVEPLKDSIEDFNNRILNLVVENVNLDSCNTALDTKLVLEIGELNSTLGEIVKENSELKELVGDLRAGVRR
jgi:regulator of replication initiation timing